MADIPTKIADGSNAQHKGFPSRNERVQYLIQQ